MTIKEQKFCDELLSDPDFNKTMAYKKAYQNVKNDNVAAAAASRLMNKPEIKEYIEKQLAELHNEKTADAPELLGKRYGLYTDKLDVNNEAEEKKAEKLDNIASILAQMTPVREGE